jgi:hypothetical protein
MTKDELKNDTAEKEAYLDYYRKVKKKGSTPVGYGTWATARRKGKWAESKGMTRVNRTQVENLSDDDFAEISKMF